MEKRKQLTFQQMELSQLKQAMEECHQLAKKAKSEEDWNKVGLKAEYLVMKLSESIEEPCENAHMTVKDRTDHLSGEIKSFEYGSKGVWPVKSTVTGLPLKLGVARKVSVWVHARNACGEEIDYEGEVVQGMLTKIWEMGHTSFQ